MSLLSLLINLIHPWQIKVLSYLKKKNLTDPKFVNGSCTFIFIYLCEMFDLF